MIKLSDVLIVGGVISTVLISIVVIYMLILKMTGHSPTLVEISFGLSTLTIAALLTMAGFLINISNKVGMLAGKFEGFEKYAFKKK